MEQVVINIIDTHNAFTVTEKYTETGAPVLSYTGGESLFSTVMSSKFTFNMLNETAEDGKFLDLLTGEERRFLIEVRDMTSRFGFSDPNIPVELDLDGNLVWRGFLLPDVYTEPYKNGSFFVGFTATDGLDVLKTKPFLFYKTGTVIQYIAKCLWETGLHQQIYFAPAIENAFYQWENIQIFDECFTKYNENTDTYQYSNCYDVLSKLLKAVGATVFQYNGKWFVVGFNRKGKSLDSYRVYDPYGVFIANKQVIRSLKTPRFNKGLNVSMLSPYKTVQLNVSYQESDKAVDFSGLYKNEELTSDEYKEAVANNTIISVSPFNKWKKNAATAVRSTSEDDASYLRLSVEGNNTLHDPDERPIYDRKAPFYVTMGKVYGPPHNFDADYIELKADETVYISPQVEGKDLTFDVDMEFKIFRDALDKGRFDDDFYRQALRVDLRIDDDVVFSTRAETSVYNSGDTKLTFNATSVGPKYYWYVFPDYLKPIYVLDRFTMPAHLKAEVKKTGIKTDSFGKLNLRIYIPKNGDETFGFNDYHVSDVTITKLEIKVKAWDNEQYKLSREIRYTTKYEDDLYFGDGKNDLYDNLFKINDRDDYPASVNQVNLLSGLPYQDALYYYFPINQLYGDWINSRYHTLMFHSLGTLERLYAHKLFGKLGVESGLEYTTNNLRISKARIDEFRYIREFFSSIDQITVAQIILKSGGVLNASNDVPREKYIKWKRSGVTEENRYFTTYAKMIHEVTATNTVRLEGTALDIILPMDLIQFNFMGQKNFIPTGLNVDFSSGKTRLTLNQAINQTVIDYATES